MQKSAACVSAALVRKDNIMRYKQIILIIQLLEACDKEPSSENIQKIAESLDIIVTLKELDYLVAIARSMGEQNRNEKSI